jgi:ParB-like chromosome segregation protein Spo0J
MSETLHDLPLDELHRHPLNSNVMSPRLLAKLKTALQRGGPYPPLIVRPLPRGYQLLDGHHRAAVLRELGRATARCVVWPVDDDEALLLLATLNRLSGEDDPRRRALLVAALRERADWSELAQRLPERVEQLKALLSKAPAPPPPVAPTPRDALPVAVHFFLTPPQRTALNARLRELGGTREQALMQLVGVKGGGQ